MKITNSILSMLFLGTSLLPLIAQNRVGSETDSRFELLPSDLQQTVRQHQYGTTLSGAQSDATLLLDSTITYQVFDVGGGNFILQWDMRTEYLYPLTNQNLIRESLWNNDHWLFTERTWRYTDDLGRMTSALSETYDSETGIWQPNSRIRAYPSGDSETLLDSFKLEAWSAELNGWSRVLTVNNKFNKNGLLSLSVSHLDFNGILVEFRDYYYYDVNGNNILIEAFLYDSGELFEGNRDTFEYVENRLVKSTSNSPDGFGGFFPESQTTYAYTIFGELMLVRDFTYNFVSNSWNLLSSVEYQYDLSSRLITETRSAYNEAGVFDQERFSYTYVESDYLDLVIHDTYNFDDNDYDPDTRTRYFYQTTSSTDDHHINDHALTFGPNPASTFTQVNTPNEGTLDLYDQTGKLISRQNATPMRTLMDLSHIPGGAYFLILTDEHSRHIGKLVKF